MVFFSLLAQIYKKHFFKKRKSLKKTGLEKPRITFRKLLYKVNKAKRDVAELNFQQHVFEGFNMETML